MTGKEVVNLIRKLREKASITSSFTERRSGLLL